MTESILLLHGLWMRAFTLRPLARRLRAEGYAVEIFDYWSLARGPAQNMSRLVERVRALGHAPVHVVGHSLGGLMAVRALSDAVQLPPGRIVCLGSPLTGSRAAAGMARLPGGAVLLGRSRELLRDGVASWSGTREVGVIAGRSPLGLGRLFGSFREANDGTVAVAETHLPGIADHAVIASSHTGLIFSEEAARLILAFLRHGRFASAPP